jgi:hypothetical protein
MLGESDAVAPRCEGFVADGVGEFIDEVPAEAADAAGLPILAQVWDGGIGRVEGWGIVLDGDGSTVLLGAEMEADGAGCMAVPVADDVGADLLDSETEREGDVFADASLCASGIEPVEEAMQVLEASLGGHAIGQRHVRGVHGKGAEARGNQRSIFVRRRARSTGFVSKSSQPAARAWASSLLMAWAVRAIMGTLARSGVRLETSGSLPAVEDGQAHVHQDEFGPFVAGQADAFSAVHSDHDFVTPPREPPGEHVAVHLVVLDEQDPRHGRRGRVGQGRGTFRRGAGGLP